MKFWDEINGSKNNVNNYQDFMFPNFAKDHIGLSHLATFMINYESGNEGLIFSKYDIQWC